MKRSSCFLLVGIFALLVLGISAQFIFQIGRAPSADRMPQNVLPNQILGVEVKDLDIGGNELLNAAIAEGLGFSDHRYKEYRTANQFFSIYLGYWQDRQRHFMDLGTHAPDNCWVSNGMKMQPKQPKTVFQIRSNSNNSKIITWPAETRTFEANGLYLYVVYWHILNKEPIDYTRYGTGKTMGYLLDNLSSYWRGTGEQYFIRVTSSLPIHDLQKEPSFQVVLESLALYTPIRDNSKD